MATKEGEEGVRSEGTWAGNVQEGKEGPSANTEWCIPIHSKGRKERETKDAAVESKVYQSVYVHFKLLNYPSPTTIYNIDNHQGPTVQHGELY